MPLHPAPEELDERRDRRRSFWLYRLPVSTYDWLLFAHVLGALAAVAGLVILTAAMLGAARAERPSEIALFLGLARPSGILLDGGGLVLLVFGVWLAFHADYGITDEWVLAALALWLVAAVTGPRARARYASARARAAGLAREDDAPSAELAALVRDRRAFVFLALGGASLLAMLLLMVFKPGAG